MDVPIDVHGERTTTIAKVNNSWVGCSGVEKTKDEAWKEKSGKSYEKPAAFS